MFLLQTGAPRVLVETKKIKILWDFKTQTDKLVGANRPDIVVMDKHRKRAIVNNVAIPSDSNIRKNYTKRWRNTKG